LKDASSEYFESFNHPQYFAHITIHKKTEGKQVSAELNGVHGEI